MRLAQFARQHGLGYQLGCQVGETAILSAAGRHFAASVADLRYLEGSYDRHLVREALGTTDLTFGWGGWAPALAGPGLGVDGRSARACSESRFARRRCLADRPAPSRRSSPATATPGVIAAIGRTARPAAISFASTAFRATAAGTRILATASARPAIVVSFLDRRGSGLNEQARGDAPGFRRLLDDLAEFLRNDAATSGHGDTATNLSGPASPRRSVSASPLFLLAISWGGKLATALQRRHPGLVNGLILACPGFFAKVRPSLKQRLKIAWARLTAPDRRFPIPLNQPELFTATPQWQQFIRDDTLSLREATARLLIESLRLDGYLKVVPAHVRVPVLLLLAEHDRIIDNARTRRFVARFASPDVETIEYPGAHHTLEFEPEPDRHVEDVLRWIKKHW